MIRESKRERGIKVSDKENSDEELRVTAKEREKKETWLGDPASEKTMPLLLNEGIKEPTSAGYLEMQIRFRPNPGLCVLCICVAWSSQWVACIDRRCREFALF